MLKIENDPRVGLISAVNHVKLYGGTLSLAVKIMQTGEVDKVPTKMCCVERA